MSEIRVIAGVNENPLYLESIPWLLESWACIYPEADLKVILIADSLPKGLNPNKVLLFPPIENVSTVFQSQCIRLLYPCLAPEERLPGDCKDDDVFTIITDADMLPAGKKYYQCGLNKGDKFVVWNNLIFDADKIKEYSMCYVGAKPKIWRDIFKVRTMKGLRIKIVEWFNKIKYSDTHGGEGSTSDQLILYSHVNPYKNKVFILPEESGYRRLDRGLGEYFSLWIVINQEVIKKGAFSDYHIFRPITKYPIENSVCLELICSSLIYPDYKKIKVGDQSVTGPLVASTYVILEALFRYQEDRKMLDLDIGDHWMYNLITSWKGQVVLSENKSLINSSKPFNLIKCKEDDLLLVTSIADTSFLFKYNDGKGISHIKNIGYQVFYLSENHPSLTKNANSYGTCYACQDTLWLPVI